METESFTLFDENLTEWMERQFAARVGGNGTSHSTTHAQSQINTQTHAQTNDRASPPANGVEASPPRQRIAEPAPFVQSLAMDRQHTTATAPSKPKTKPPTPINMNRLLLAEKETEISVKRAKLGPHAPPQAPRPTKIKYSAKYDTERYYVDALLEWAKNDLSCINKVLDHKSF
jgi:hypothetical protein